MFKKLTRWFRRPPNSSGHVYYAKLRTPQGSFYKLGYTSKATLVERMMFGGNGDERLIERQFFFTFREDAWDVEQTLLDHFDGHRAFGKFSNDPTMPLGGRGQSELFRHDILGLDDDLYKLAEKEISKEMQREHEQVGEGCLMVLVGLAFAPFTLGLSLFLILGGASGVFGTSTSSLPGGLGGAARPAHPPAIQELIDALRRSGSAT